MCRYLSVDCNRSKHKANDTQYLPASIDFHLYFLEHYFCEAISLPIKFRSITFFNYQNTAGGCARLDKNDYREVRVRTRERATKELDVGRCQRRSVAFNPTITSRGTRKEDNADVPC